MYKKLIAGLCLCVSFSCPLSVWARFPLERTTAPQFTESIEEEIAPALQRHIELLALKNQEKRFTLGDKSYSNADFLLSLKHFKALIEKCSGAELQARLEQDFDIYQAQGQRENNALITGYFEPTFFASNTADEIYKYPIYTLPSNLVAKGNEVFLKTETGALRPYPSHRTIKEEQLLQGEELAYLQNPVDVFVLHVQGSGKLQYPDGSTISVGYAGNNGHRYHSIGAYMAQAGLMELESINMESLRDYLELHPEKAREIFLQNPRYIFFKKIYTQNPLGSLGIALTPERSIAIDQRIYPWQAVYFMETTVPATANKIEHKGRLSGFVMAQDSGAAIKGPRRIDYFWGNGTDAAAMASHMKEDGKIYFLIKKGLGEQIPQP